MAFRDADDTFFVESDEPHLARLDSRTAARLILQNRQDMIASDLSRLAGDEYLEDIMLHMKEMEARIPPPLLARSTYASPLSKLTCKQDETLADASLIDMQREIQWYMRPYLIDFLIEAHAAFALLPETLYLTVNLLDRYCSKRVVYKQHYQLVGCAALLIAAKYGDKKDRVPQIHELSNMCCGLYDAGMFIQMEQHVLNTLEWKLGHPTVEFFAKLMVTEEYDNREVEQMASYLSENALYHRDFVSTKPSIIARSCLALSRAILGRPEVNDGEWDHEENLTLLTLSQHLDHPPAPLARKYSTPQMSRVAQKLADFMAEQAAMAAHASNPPPPAAKMTSKHADIYSTPQKGHGAMMGFEGYLTPPITPDGACFGNGNRAAEDAYTTAPGCPVTPTPQHQQSSHANYAQQACQYGSFPVQQRHQLHGMR
ncbi:hypothetical protein E4U22_007957 [Claviceps purpurea]|nr:hypothetical protein E4U37_002491 [Claviceps purpurea]KAG6192523.1 hypothetical protein E4U27_002865 [Claviceps purpurea]KAG6216026.1 hypothetical protein E4U34_005349 [Claviceps purpurea]KAG6243009.1 hypothetical protein E4U25_002286 [Claviceps purpurea]KAG6315332.1 hypothetical protein E4U22_007957 [Claviceps purpurea]